MNWSTLALFRMVVGSIVCPSSFRSSLHIQIDMGIDLDRSQPPVFIHVSAYGITIKPGRTLPIIK